MFAHKPYKNNLGQFQKKKLPIGFSNSFFSSKQLKRKFPVQAALHTILDGALIGVLLTVAVMSSVALHTQYLWSEAFTKLEKTRDLNRRMLESTSILESYLLKNQKMSRTLVPTKAKDLVYVDEPIQQNTKFLLKERFKKRFLEKISSSPARFGY